MIKVCLHCGCGGSFSTDKPADKHQGGAGPKTNNVELECAPSKNRQSFLMEQEMRKPQSHSSYIPYFHKSGSIGSLWLKALS